MEQSAALNRLLEATDLVGLIEDLLNASNGKLSPTAMSGLKITLRNIREGVLASHDVLAQEMVSRAKAHVATGAVAPTTPAAQGDRTVFGSIKDSPISQRGPVLTESDKTRYTRHDLRASLEKVIDG